MGLLYMLFSEVGEVHDRVLEHPKIQRLLNDSTPTHFDVTFVSPLFNEMGLYFGRKFESSVILYMAPVKTMLPKLCLCSDRDGSERRIEGAEILNINVPNLFF